MIAAGVKAFKDVQADFVIGVGGGSPIDAAKAIALMAKKSKNNISSFMGNDIEEGVYPIVAIPTTSGTGSETTKFMVITAEATDTKMLLAGQALLPTIAVLDYRYTLTCPSKVTAATGLDALTHAVEAYTSKKSNKLTDVHALSAIKTIFMYLVRTIKDGQDIEAREQMLLAAYEAGICINNASVTIVHGMSRPIGALFHVSHGLSNAMLLGTCLSYVADGAIEKFARLGREIEVATSEMTDQEASDCFITSLEKLGKACGVGTLAEYGINKEEFFNLIPKMARDAMASGSPDNTRKKLTTEDLEIIYKKLW
jgi:alcohol dehydrogenase class IV